MGTVSKNGLDLIKSACSQVKGKFVKAFLGTLVAYAPLIAFCFIPYAGWALSVFLFGVINTGYIRFMRGVLKGENPSLLVIFSEVKTGWLETFLGTVLALMFILGTVLLIVPGVMLICFYSMSLFMAEKYQAKTIGEAMYLSQTKMEGNITSLLSYKSIFWFGYILLLLVAAFGGWGIVALYASSPVLAVLLGIIATLVFMILFSVVTVYYHSCNEFFFQEILVLDEQKQVKRAKKAQPSANVAEAPKTEETPVVEAQQAPAKPAKAPVKKTTTTTKAGTKAPAKTATKTSSSTKTTNKTNK